MLFHSAKHSEEHNVYIRLITLILNIILFLVTFYIFRAMSSDRNKELFLQQVQQILDGIKQDKDQLVQRCQEERKDKDALNKSYLELIEQQRAYYKAVKDFQEVRKPEVPYVMIIIFLLSLMHVYFFFYIFVS